MPFNVDGAVHYPSIRHGALPRIGAATPFRDLVKNWVVDFFAAAKTSSDDRPGRFDGSLTRNDPGPVVQ